MARKTILKSDRDKYLSELKSKIDTIEEELKNRSVERIDAKKFYNDDKIEEDDMKQLTNIDSTTLQIACENANQAIKNIMTIFVKSK